MTKRGPNNSTSLDINIHMYIYMYIYIYIYINVGLRTQLFYIFLPFCFLLLHYRYTAFLGSFVTNLTLWKVMLRKRVKEIENERNGMVKLSQEATKGEVT